MRLRATSSTDDAVYKHSLDQYSNVLTTALMIVSDVQFFSLTSGIGRQFRMFFIWSRLNILPLKKGLGSWTTIVRLPKDRVSQC
jgi:hypothetical protein